MLLLRALSTSARTLYTATPLALEKSSLAKLRRSTGYSFSKCKEALQKHDNNLKQAEEWLKIQAQAHGWEKATKLQGRATAQGLISIISSHSNAVMCEINCETDFVARNKKFQSLVNKVTQGCFQFSKEQEKSMGTTNYDKVLFTGDELSNIPISNTADGTIRPVKDEVALSIGEIVENIKTRRGICFQTSPTSQVVLAGYTHPAPQSLQTSEVQHGKYGAVVAFKSTKPGKTSLSPDLISLIGRQLCQHIVGMNPKEIGSMDQPPPPPVEENIVVQCEKPPVSDENIDNIPPTESEDTESDIPPQRKHEIDEHVLVNQEFLLDPDITVREFLVQNSIEIVDFVRYEVGEVIELSELE